MLLLLPFVTRISSKANKQWSTRLVQMIDQFSMTFCCWRWTLSRMIYHLVERHQLQVMTTATDVKSPEYVFSFDRSIVNIFPLRVEHRPKSFIEGEKFYSVLRFKVNGCQRGNGTFLHPVSSIAVVVYWDSLNDQVDRRIFSNERFWHLLSEMLLNCSTRDEKFYVLIISARRLCMYFISIESYK